MTERDRRRQKKARKASKESKEKGSKERSSMDWVEFIRVSLINAGIGSFGATAAFIIVGLIQRYWN